MTAARTPGSSGIFSNYLKAILLALLVAWVIRSFVLEVYRIPNEAMGPTLLSGDTILVTKFDYGLVIPGSELPPFFQTVPRRGDLVVFETQGLSSRETLKRVIGIPGDRVEVRKGDILLNGKPLGIAAGNRCRTEALPNSGDADSDVVGFTSCREDPLLPDRPPTVLSAGQVFVAPDLRSETALLAPPSAHLAKTPWDRKDQLEHAWGVIPLGQLRGRARWIWISLSPPQENPGTGWTSRIRWNRMLRRIDSTQQ